MSGTVLNALKRIEGFYLWGMGGVGWVIICLVEPGNYLAQLPMWVLNLFFAALGIYIWTKKKE